MLNGGNRAADLARAQGHNELFAVGLAHERVDEVIR